MIEAVGLTKSFGSKTAVYNLTFQVQPGKVTGFLGPNGAGKSTTMRMILGLDAPTGGTVTIGGYPYRQLPNAPRQVGALLDANAKHGGRSARSHLLCLAQLAGIPARRVDEVLGVVGLHEVASKRSKGFSLGMGQRLGIAAALLGDPQVLLFDEPVNGLDPEGILWIRTLMRRLASEGRTVFVSSHLMSEMAQTADHLIVIGRGQLMADMPVREFIERNSTGFARVRTPQDEPQQRDRLVKELSAAGGRVQPEEDGALRVTGLELPRISDVAHAADVRLWELSPHTASLEEAYMRMTQGAVDFRSTADQRSGLQQAVAGPAGYAPGMAGPAQPAPAGQGMPGAPVGAGMSGAPQQQAPAVGGGTQILGTVPAHAPQPAAAPGGPPPSTPPPGGPDRAAPYSGDTHVPGGIPANAIPSPPPAAPPGGSGAPGGQSGPGDAFASGGTQILGTVPGNAPAASGESRPSAPGSAAGSAPTSSEDAR